MKALLKPEQVRLRARMGTFKDVWAGSYNTIARTTSGEVSCAYITIQHLLLV